MALASHCVIIVVHCPTLLGMVVTDTVLARRAHSADDLIMHITVIVIYIVAVVVTHVCVTKTIVLMIGSCRCPAVT